MILSKVFNSVIKLKNKINNSNQQHWLMKTITIYDLRFTIYDLQFTIYDLQITITITIYN
jgi:hypothetical protein